MSTSRLSKFLGSVTTAAILAAPMAVVPTSQGWSQGAIVVTARRREETLQDVPIAVTVFSQQQLNNAGISGIQDLSDFTPGFNLENSDGQGGGRQNADIRFRGIAQQINFASSRIGAVFWDGAYVSSGIGFIPLIDLERVEVLKGPQNAQFARNTFAGAVNYIPKEPGDEFEANASFEVNFGTGSDEQVGYSTVIAAGGPVTEKVGLRLAGQYERVGGDYEFLNGEPMGEEHNMALFGVATFEATDSLRFKASGFFVDAEDTTIAQSVRGEVAPGDCGIVFSGATLDGLSGVETPFMTDLSLSTQNLFCGTIPNADNPGLSPYGTFASPGAVALTSGFGPTGGQGSIDRAQSTDPRIEPRGFEVPDGFGSTYRAFRGQLGSEWDLPNNHTFRTLTSWGVAKSWRINDFLYGDDGDLTTPTTTMAFPTDRQEWTRDFFAEARLASDPEQRVRYEIGVSYYDQIFEGATNAQRDFQSNEAIGIFGSLDIDVTDQITVSGEGRWVHDTQTLEYVGSFGVMPGMVGAEIGEVSHYTDFMPRAIIQYEPNDFTNIYFSWAQGSLNTLPTRATTFDDQAPGIIDPSNFPTFTDIQRLTSFEIGIKQNLDFMRYSIAAYHMKWQNQPFNNVVLLSSGTTPVLTLPGDSRYWGIDFEVGASPIEGLDLVGTVGWVNAELTKLGATGSVATNVLAPGCQALVPANPPFLPPNPLTGTPSDPATCSPFTSFAHVPSVLLDGVISGNGNRPRYIAEWTATMSATYTHPFMNRDWYVRGDAIYEGGRFVDNFAYNMIPGYWRANFRLGVDFNEMIRAEAFVTNAFQNTTLQNGGTTSINFGGANNGRKTFSVLPKKREVGFRMLLNY